MKNTYTFLLFLICVIGTAQTKADFENYNLDSGDFINNNEQGFFESGNVIMPNTYDANYDFWTGWAVSKATDTETPGFNNQYSSIVGAGNENSVNYAVGYASGPIKIYLAEEAIGKVIDGLSITNSTYAFKSMELGDAFAKKFGGATGEDPDYFLLTIKKWYDGEMGVDSVDFYLADFRSDNAADDYIVDQWEAVDLSILGNVDSLQVTLSSTDIGQFGMNTPAYFCVDDVITANISGSRDIVQSLEKVSVFPNPASNEIDLNVDSQERYDYTVYNSTGGMVMSGKDQSGNSQLDISMLTFGSYYVIVRNNDGARTVQFQKM